MYTQLSGFLRSTNVGRTVPRQEYLPPSYEITLLLPFKTSRHSYVWLVPEYTKSVSDACTGFDVIVQKDSVSQFPDLASGCGGVYRHLKPAKDSRNQNKVVDVGLLRSPTNNTYILATTAGRFNCLTGDINKGRGGDFLYLAYRTEEAETRVTVEVERIQLGFPSI